MIYFGGVTLGHFNLYPVGFQPKDRTDDGVTAAGGKAGCAAKTRFPTMTARLLRGVLPAMRNPR